ncbi:MAG: hypothetical protein AAF580_12890 [Pseudomonadota bacterium]
MIRSAPVAAAVAVATLIGATVPFVTSAEASRCGMINVGTPEKPKIIPDPSGCSTGGGR